VVDPSPANTGLKRVQHWKEKASSGVPELARMLIAAYGQ